MRLPPWFKMIQRRWLKMRSSIEIKLPNTKQQYYVLKVFNDDGSIKMVHTSKNLNYVKIENIK